MRNILVFVFLFIGTKMIAAQEIELMNKFENYSHTLDSTTIPYRMFIPPDQENEKFPLIPCVKCNGKTFQSHSGWKGSLSPAIRLRYSY